TSAGVRSRIVGDTVYLTLEHPANLSVEFDGDKHHNLHIFAGAIVPAPPAGTDVVIFGPGVHRPQPPNPVFTFQSGQTVWSDGAAVLEAGISLDSVHDVTVKGHGLIERPTADTRMTNTAEHDNRPDAHIDGSAAIAIRNSSHIRIEGLTVINPPGVSVGCM